MKIIKVLVFEDDLETVETIFSVLKKIGEEKNIDFGVTVIPDYIQGKDLINRNPQIKFGLVLLDRDDFSGSSFHYTNLGGFDIDSVISISSVPQYNEDAKKLGIKRIVLKDYSDLGAFAKNLERELKQIV